jgi:hypothetical protein
LNKLEADIRAQSLPNMYGDSDDTMIADDLKFITAARKALSKGCTVLYTSSW